MHGIFTDKINFRHRGAIVQKKKKNGGAGSTATHMQADLVGSGGTQTCSAGCGPPLRTGEGLGTAA